MFVSFSQTIIKKIFFDSIILLRFGGTKVTKEEIYGAKTPVKIWAVVNVNNIVISDLVETMNYYNYLIGYLDKVRSQLVLILPKMSAYVEILKV